MECIIVAIMVIKDKEELSTFASISFLDNEMFFLQTLVNNTTAEVLCIVSRLMMSWSSILKFSSSPSSL